MESKGLQIASDLDTEQEEVEIIGIHTLCRLCASQNERLIGIFSEEGISNDLSNKINLYLPVKVAATDDLPLQCCWNCASTLLAWHELVITSVEVDKKFRNSQFITEKPVVEDGGFNNPVSPLSDENDACDNEGLVSGEGDIVALFRQIQRERLQLSQSEPPNEAYENNAITDEYSVDPNAIVCEICDKILSCRSNYISHLKTHISDNYCSICCNSYNTKFKLNDHFTSHKNFKDAPQRYVQCNFENCHQRFPSKLQLHNHRNAHFNVIKFKCDVCGIEFWKRSALENHKMRHKKKILCKVCGKEFANKKTLRDHKRLHTGEKPFKCDLCNERFRCQSGLKYHEVTHTNEKKYHCQLCGMKFLRSNYLKDHLRIHSKEKPYQCQHCNEKFIQMGVLKRHEARMHVKCDVCQAVVGRKSELKEHKWKYHNHETEVTESV